MFSFLSKYISFRKFPLVLEFLNEQRQEVQLEPTYSRKQWTIGRYGERGSEISVLRAQHDHGDKWHIYLCGWFNAKNIFVDEHSFNSRRDKEGSYLSQKVLVRKWM